MRFANISCSLLNSKKAGYKVDTSSERCAQSTIRIMIYMRLSRLFVWLKATKATPTSYTNVEQCLREIAAFTGCCTTKCWMNLSGFEW